MLRETAELTSPEVAMVHRGERVLLLHQVVLGRFFCGEVFGDFGRFFGICAKRLVGFLEI